MTMFSLLGPALAAAAFIAVPVPAQDGSYDTPPAPEPTKASATAPADVPPATA